MASAPRQHLTKSWSLHQGLTLQGDCHGLKVSFKVCANREFKSGELILQEQAPAYDAVPKCCTHIKSQPWCPLMLPRY